MYAGVPMLLLACVSVPSGDAGATQVLGVLVGMVVAKSMSFPGRDPRATATP
jgi:hypothetical protein